MSAKTNGGTVMNRYFYPHSTGQHPLAGNVYAPLKMLSNLSTLNYINLYCSPTATTGVTQIATINVFTNMNTTPFKTYSVTKDEASRGYITIPIQKPFVNAIQIEIIWDTSSTIGTSDFLPMYAEIDYTSTDTSR